MKRKWNQESKYYWRCVPWGICLAFVDGCSLYCLSKDGIDEPIAYKDDLKELMNIARELENGNK